MAVAIQNLHIEPSRAQRKLTADAAKADDAQRGVMDVRSQHHHRAPRLPAILADVLIALGDTPRGGHQQRKGRVRGRGGQHTGGIADGDPVEGARGYVEVVEADREGAHHLELRSRALEQLVINLLGHHGQQSIDACDAAQELLAEWRRIVGPDIGVGLRGDAIETLLRDPARDEDACSCFGSHRADYHITRQRLTQPEHAACSCQGRQGVDSAWVSLRNLRSTHAIATWSGTSLAGKRSRTVSIRTSTFSRTTARVATRADPAPRCICSSRSRWAASCAGTSATPRSALETASSSSPATPSRSSMRCSPPTTP